MSFDLDLIERGLLTSATTAVQDAARDEFAKLRNTLAARTEHDADDLATLGAPVPRYWLGKIVWMVPIDD